MQLDAASFHAADAMPFAPAETMTLTVHEAIKGGNKDLAAFFIENGASVNDKDNYGNTALHIAAKAGSASTALLLLQKGADHDSSGARQRTPLELAALGGHARVVQILLEAGASVRDGLLALAIEASVMYVAKETMDVVETMIEFGVDVNDQAGGGWTPLHAAVGKKLVDALIDAGAKIEAREEEGKTPLNRVFGMDTVRALVNHGADVNTQDKYGNTPLHNAILETSDPERIGVDMAEMVDFLLRAGADETMVDNQGKTARQRLDACSRGGYFIYPEVSADEITVTLELLANAPADRRWRRRALLVMCIARHRKREGQLLDEATGGASDKWTRVALWLLHAGLESGMDGIFRTIVGYL